MNVLKKIKIINPKTGNKITIPSALSSDDPNMQDLGKKKAKDVIDKAKDQMTKSSGLKKKLDRQRRPDDPGVKIKGYDKTDPYLQKVHTLKPPSPKKTKKDPDKPKADHEHSVKRTMTPANKKKYDAAVQKEKEKAEKMVKDDPSIAQPVMMGGGNSIHYGYPGDDTHYHATGYDPTGERGVDKEKYYDPLTPEQQAYQDYQKARETWDRNKRRGDTKIGMDKRFKDVGDSYVEPKPSDFPGAQAHIDKAKGIEPTSQEPEKKKKKSSSKKSSSKKSSSKKNQQQPGYPYHPDNPNRLMRAGKNLSRKEAKQYVKENKEEVLKYVIKRIIKEEKENLITEGTRWLVGIEQPNGKVTSTYGHYDGYPEWAGKHLKKYYNNPAKAKELLKLGKSGISTIGPKIKGSKDHSFEKPDKGVTVFYGRDRGEKDNWLSNWKNRDAVKFNSGEEYAYIYNLKEKQWYYKAEYGNPQEWTKLK